MEDQLKRLEPFVDELTDTLSSWSHTTCTFVSNLQSKMRRRSTWYCRPTECSQHNDGCEGVVKLFRLVKHKQELHWNSHLLNLTQSSNSENLRPLFYNQRRQDYLLSSSNPYVWHHSTRWQKKWTTYKFTNVYNMWMPTHLKGSVQWLMSCLQYRLWGLAGIWARESGLSQGLESHHLSDQSSQSSHVPSRDITPDTSLSQNIEQSI
jgi:hypothetical protein